eukprot:gene9012-1111_t
MRKELHSGPIKVQGHTFIEYKKNFYLFGGRIPNKSNEKRSYSNSLFVFSPEKNIWKEIESKNSPEPLHNHSCSVYKNCFFIFGGSGYKGYSKGFYKFDLEKLEWENMNCDDLPKPRHAHTSNIYKNTMLIFGGHLTLFDSKPSRRTFFNDLHEYNFETNKWKLVSTYDDVPEGRSWHSSKIMKDSLIVFGGFYMKNRGEFYFNDLNILNLLDKKWLKIVINSISPRNRHSCTVINSNQMLIYGGNYFKNGKDIFLKDSHIITLFDENTKIKCDEITKKSNITLSNHTSIYFEQLIYFYGGEVDRTISNKFFTFQIE